MIVIVKGNHPSSNFPLSPQPTAMFDFRSPDSYQRFRFIRSHLRYQQQADEVTFKGQKK